MTYTISDKVHVDLRVDGKTISEDFGPGDVELPPAVAELLLAQGLATETSAKTSKTKSTPATETSEG